MMTEVKIKYIRGRKFIAIDGELYISTSTKFTKDNHIQEMTFLPLKDSEKKYKEKIDYLVDKLSEHVSIKDVLRQKLYEMQVSQINNLITQLKKGAKPKRRYGCLGLVVGKESVEILE